MIFPKDIREQLIKEKPLFRIGTCNENLLYHILIGKDYNKHFVKDSNKKDLFLHYCWLLSHPQYYCFKNAPHQRFHLEPFAMEFIYKALITNEDLYELLERCKEKWKEK